MKVDKLPCTGIRLDENMNDSNFAFVSHLGM